MMLLIGVLAFALGSVGFYNLSTRGNGGAFFNQGGFRLCAGPKTYDYYADS
jgi:hypothetical protein